MRWAGHVVQMQEGRGMYRILVGRPRSRCEDNIKMDLQQVGCRVMDWIELAQDRGTCECGNEPSGSIKCGEFLD
jgi:hypothetical protein